MSVDSDTKHEKNIERITMFLRKAEDKGSTPEEARTFFEAAQRLAERSMIDLEMIRQKDEEAGRARRSEPISKEIEIGRPGDRGAGAYADLLAEMALVNDVQTYLSNSHATLYGYPEDIQLTELMFGAILQQMVKECYEYIESDEWRGQVTIHEARRSFYAGFRTEIVRRLWREKEETRAQMEKEYQEKGQSTALVLRNKKENVRRFYWDALPSNAGWRRPNRATHSGSRAAGNNAARRARTRANKGNVE